MHDEPNQYPPASSASNDAGANTSGVDSADDAAVEAALPGAAGESRVGRAAQRHPDPTRYGDWEKGGRCIDF